MDMNLLERELRRDEGVRREAYLDTEGHWTVGIGYNLDVHSLPEGVTMPLSDEEVKTLFDISAKDVIKGLDTYLPWWKKLDEVRQRVMFNMAFNLGIHGLLQFTNTLRSVQDGKYEVAATNMLKSKWAKQVGRRAIRLAYSMKTGVST